MTRLEKIYREKVVPVLQKEFNYSSSMQLPGIEKISLNIGLGAASQNNKLMEEAVAELTAIAGQKAVVTRAKKSIAAFKLREGMPIGARVTLRKDRMWDFLDKLMNFALPRVEDDRHSRAQHGLRRTLLANCIEGVTKGFSKSLEVIGVGYRVAVKGNLVELSVGFSHPVLVELPEGIQAKAEGQILTISGADKDLVGEMAAKIRRIRKPEPYKGKGIKYTTETIRRKVGKSGGKK